LVGDSAQEAIARHQIYLDHTYRVQYAPERTGMTYRDPATGERKPLTSDNPYFMSEAYMRDRWFVGTPEDVATSIVEWQRRMSLDVLLFHPKMPGMKLKHAVEEVERVTKQVMPLVRRKLVW
jgi:alkanesulfonate monooxygenase SsuD/methylene tetrahydromethanopterin reductase-like flavin-dependent oxidoreductase (luciferase family)